MPTSIRPLTELDLEAYANLAAYSFNTSREEVLKWMNALRRHEMLGLFDRERLASALTDYRYEVWLHGALVRASGLGAVASAPETRQRGWMRALLAVHLERLRADQVHLSLLYPFKFSFYRRLGWGLGSRRVEVKFPPADLAAFGRPGGRVRHLLYGEQGKTFPADGETLESVAELLDGIYASQANEYNLAARRTLDNWVSIFELAFGRRHVFTWETDDGRPEGYVILRAPSGENTPELIVREMFALTPRAWQGLCHFLAGHEAQHKNLVLTFPDRHPIFDLLDKPEIQGAKVLPSPMARAVDVISLLEARGPAGAFRGSCRMKVGDALAPWNAGVFAVAYEDGRVHVVRDSSETTPDLEMDIDVFSSLAVGLRPLEDYLRVGLVRGRPGAGLEFASSLFPPRPVWHLEFY